VPGLIRWEIASVTSCATSSKTYARLALGSDAASLGAALPFLLQFGNHLQDSAFQQAEEEVFRQLRGKYDIATLRNMLGHSEAAKLAIQLSQYPTVAALEISFFSFLTNTHHVVFGMLSSIIS
jgi:hypothetical protein